MTATKITPSAVILLAIVVLAAIAALVLNAIPLALLGAAAPWARMAARRWGLGPAVAFSILGSFWTLTLVLVLTAAAGVRMDLAAPILLGLAGLGGVALASLTHASVVHKLEWPPFLAALSGSALWFGFQVASQVLPPFERLSWVMRNDSMNNLIFARNVLHIDGILLGGQQNPAPLPAAIVAIFMDAGRQGVPSSLLVEHDLAGLSLGWGVLIALTCLLAGLAAAAMARRAGGSIRLQTLASGLASIAILSWYATGAAMEYGFINTHVSLVVLFSLVLIVVSTRLGVATTVSALAVGSTVMLAVWSPLAVVPLALLAQAILSRRRELFALRGRRLALVIISGVQLLAWGAGVTVVTLVSQRDALAGAGGIFRSPWWLVFLVGIAAVVLDRVAQRSTGAKPGLQVPVVVGAAFAGIAFLLYVSRRSPDIWTYYPVKLSWFLTLLLGVLLLGLLVGILGRLSRTIWRRAALAVIAAAVAVLVAWTPDITPNLAMNPLDRLVRSQSVERIQQLHEEILANADPENPVLFWHDLEWGEAEVDLWLISLKADTLNTTPLRMAAYSSYTDRSIEQLCNLIELMGPNLTVRTSEPGLEDEARATCAPLGDVTFSVS